MWLLGFELRTFGRAVGCSYPLSHLTSPTGVSFGELTSGTSPKEMKIDVRKLIKLFSGFPVIGLPHQQGLSKAGLFRMLHQHFVTRCC
ncbi:mCG1036304 [Mus musculus]|nr:mCG1036304 [Mus musculus]